MLYLKIFFGKMVDVTLSTLVTIYIVKNKRLLATIIGFIDVFIWLLVVNEALNNSVNSLSVALSYSLGYAFGTYSGSLLSNLINNDIVNVQIVTKNENNIITNKLKESKFSASMIECIGIHKEDKKFIIYATIKHKDLNNFKEMIRNLDNNAFLMVSDSKEIIGGYIV